ncbi:MAG TPA: energy transducer TonB [Vicinamibacteria bacterium]|nr:energy transducer TonB [Vicinamibacteria bacterium]
MAGPITIQGFETLAQEARHEGGQPDLRPRRTASPGRPAPEPTLTLGNYGLTGVDAAVRARRGVAVPVSIGLHAGAAVAVALVPLLLAEGLPLPARDIRAFFVEPLAAPAPPPPPPPPAAREAVVARVAAKPSAAPVGFVAPIEVPSEIVPEEGLDLDGVEGGVVGGVEGGVPGGVVGGVVGGLPDAPPPPPVQAVRVGGDIREPRKITHVAPVYPMLAVQARVEGVVILEATIDPRGRVVNATVLRGVPVLEEAALEAVRKWVYTPTLLDGVPTPIIMTVTVRFRLQNAG